jgi:hypothetical protein
MYSKIEKMNKIEVDNWKDSCVFYKYFTSYQVE